MKTNSTLLLLYFLLGVGFLGGCGTRDYGDTKAKEGVKKESGGPVKDRYLGDTTAVIKPDSNPVLENEEEFKGYLWSGMEFIEVPEDQIFRLEEAFKDRDRTDHFCIGASTVMAGGILALLMRVGGSWFFTGPVDNPKSHWFWSRVVKTEKLVTENVVRGGALAGACYLALTGMSSISFNGLIGSEFRGLSSSLVMGFMSAGVGSVFYKKAAERDWTQFKKMFGRFKGIKDFARAPFGKPRGGQGVSGGRLAEDFGNIVRYEIFPGAFVIGTGAGVGILTYNFLEGYCGEEESEEDVKE